MHFRDKSPPRQVKRPNLEGKEGGVDNGPYDNDASNFVAPTANGTNYHIRVCVGIPERNRVSLCSKNPHTGTMKLGQEWRLPS